MDCVNSIKCLSENGNLIQNLYTGQEATIQIYKPTIYAEYALREAGVEDKHGLKMDKEISITSVVLITLF